MKFVTFEHGGRGGLAVDDGAGAPRGMSHIFDKAVTSIVLGNAESPRRIGRKNALYSS